MVRGALRARRVSELHFGARNCLDAMDCGKTGRSVVSRRIISDLATRSYPNPDYGVKENRKSIRGFCQ